MSETAYTLDPALMRKEKRAAALLSVLAACAMTALKLVAGLLTGSLGVLSDAAHSGLDLVGSALTFLSVRVADKPADDAHTYGHGKFENLSAFLETFLMAASCLWISAEAVMRIFVHPVTVRIEVWIFLVLFASIATDLWRSHKLKRVAERYGSAALEADALHFASDIWSSVAVLVGLTGVWVGARFHIAWLHYADAIAALAVSLLILRFAVQLARKTVADLLDAAPADTQHKIIEAVRHIDGVLAVDQARVRRAGAAYFADLTLSLSRQLTFQRTEDLVHEATAAVQQVLPNADVVIHTVPRSTLAETIFDKVRAVAAHNNVLLHDVSIQSLEGQLHVEQHVELPETMCLRDAHAFVRRIEDEISRELPQVASVLTHIESEPATIERTVVVERDRNIESHLRSAAASLPQIVDIHDVIVGRSGDHLQLSCHCTLPDELEMHRVHDLITELEDRFKLECPEVSRVLIHPEPVSDNQHEAIRRIPQ